MAGDSEVVVEVHWAEEMEEAWVPVAWVSDRFGLGKSPGILRLPSRHTQHCMKMGSRQNYGFRLGVKRVPMELILDSLASTLLSAYILWDHTSEGAEYLQLLSQKIQMGLASTR